MDLFLQTCLVTDGPNYMDLFLQTCLVTDGPNYMVLFLQTCLVTDGPNYGPASTNMSLRFEAVSKNPDGEV